MKTDQVNLRLEVDLIAAVERAAEEEAIDRGTMFRKLIREALGHRRVEQALRRYQHGELSVGRAAEEGGLTQWDLLDLARARGIAYPLTPEAAESRVGLLTRRTPRVAERRAAYRATRHAATEVPESLPDRPPARDGVLLVGINPAPISVTAGHYYQGKLGKRLWRRLEHLGLLANAAPGHEDDAFVAAGNGLTDVVKRPSRSATEITPDEFARGAEALRAKVRAWAPRLILFTFAQASRAALSKRNVKPGPCEPLEGVPTFLLSGPYASGLESDRVDGELLGALGGEHARAAGLTQRVTRDDLALGRIRLPREAKGLFPTAGGDVDIVLRGVRLRATYDPRRGPDRERSAVLRVDRKRLAKLVRPDERLSVRIGPEGTVHLG